MRYTASYLPLLLLLVSPLASLATTSAPNTGDQLQGFTFGYTTSNLVLPVVPTCPTPLTLTQLSPTNAGGPDPVAPYTMIVFAHEQLEDGADIAYERIYAATLNVGDMSKARSIQHPFANGTQFISCIWSSNGVSGGCQDLITVIPNDATAAAYANATSTCRTPSVMGSWVTPSNITLDVDIHGASGVVSTNAWPPSCSDLKFTPKNGTAPYTLVIAPASHPPVNISSSGSSDNSMNYTVRLTHGQAFMAGIFDSAGNSWAIGPLHAGHSGDLSCLAVATGQNMPSSGGKFGVGALAGGIVGAFIVGAIGAYALAWFMGRNKRTHKRGGSSELLDPYADPRPATYRANSGFSTTSYTKPLNSFSTTAYTDMTPPLGPDTPETLYDPAPVPTSGYPTPPSVRDSRPFPRPPENGAYPIPFDTQAAYHEHVLQDFGPQQRDRESLHSRDRSGSDGQGHPHRDSVGSTTSQRGGVSGSGGRGRVPPGRAVRHSMGSPISRNRSFHEEDEDDEGELGSPGKARNVYVVHSDAGGADMHIHLPNRSNVIELPPGYIDDPRYNNTAGSPRPGSIGSWRSGQDRDREYGAVHPPLLRPESTLYPSRSRGSGFSDMTEEEIRARAEAALAEKSRTSGNTYQPAVPGPRQARDGQI